MPRIVIHPLVLTDIVSAARLLAASMRDNPLHARVFADDAGLLEPLLARAFAHLLRGRLRNGQVFGAFDGDALVGVAAMAPPGRCQPDWSERLTFLTVLLRGRALRHVFRIRHWLRCWARHDPATAHWHLGPAAVARTRQGQGIGSQLMAAICAQLDELHGVGYLETDKSANVRLYGRGGFEVIASEDVLGVTNWFMLRQPRESAGGARTAWPSSV